MGGINREGGGGEKSLSSQAVAGGFSAAEGHGGVLRCVPQQTESKLIHPLNKCLLRHRTQRNMISALEELTV